MSDYEGDSDDESLDDALEMAMEEEPIEPVDEDDTNYPTYRADSGVHGQYIVGRTLRFVTTYEFIKLLSERVKQLHSTHISPETPPAHPLIREKFPHLINALDIAYEELRDPNIEFPVKIKRGDRELIVHKDLYITSSMYELPVFTDEHGHVCYDNDSHAVTDRYASAIAESKVYQENLGVLQRRSAARIRRADV